MAAFFYGKFAEHFVLPFLATIVAILLLRPLANRIGLVDIPGARKVHQGQIPLLGGIAMFISLALTCYSVHVQDKHLTGFFLGAGLLVLVGIWDDWKDIGPWTRVSAQAAATLAMVYVSGLYLHNVGNIFGTGIVSLGLGAIPFTLFCVIGVINAVNMSDGADGLAGGTALIALGWFSVSDALAGGQPLAGHTIILTGAVAGFLLFNFRFPWQRRFVIFMGDAGSMLLGYALAWTAVSLSQRTAHPIPPITAVWILGLPVMDTISVMIRRKIKGRRVFSADRDHLHHLLHKAGLTIRQTVLLLYLIALVCGLIGVAGWQLGASDALMASLFLITFAFYSLGAATLSYKHESTRQSIRTRTAVQIERR